MREIKAEACSPRYLQRPLIPGGRNELITANHHRHRRVLLPLNSALFVSLAVVGPARAEQESVSVYIFWQKGCPYCAAARTELKGLAKVNPIVELKAFELGTKADTDTLFERILAFFEYERAAVPLVIIGDRSFLGFLDGGRSAALYKDAVDWCLNQHCADIVATLSERRPAVGQQTKPPPRLPSGGPAPQLLQDVINLPLIGEVQTRDLSLPALTVLLAAIDGFNPCAMWVLVFLIGLLLGLKDKRRMWILGGAFLGATAVMYLAVMAAWLNLLLFLGAIVWIRFAVGALAIGGGFYFLREYWTKPEAACRVTNPTRRQKIMSAFRAVVNNNRLMLSVVGIMALAVMVNFIELLCSAGIPAVYTQTLVLSDLTTAGYYSYLLLYIAVFMFDDVAIFATAMFTLQVTGLTGSFARISHLIGGIVLLVIGAIMLLRPELLSFS